MKRISSLLAIVLFLSVSIFQSAPIALANYTGVWTARYEAAEAFPKDIKVDASGNVYVAGITFNENNYDDYDYTTIKYDANGNCLWVSKYDGPVHGRDSIYAMTIDSFGNVYVTGASQGTGGGANQYSIATIKYDASGNEL